MKAYVMIKICPGEVKEVVRRLRCNRGRRPGQYDIWTL